MALPEGSVTLSVQQLDELHRKLANLRHDINNHLALIVAAAELIKFNTDLAQRMSATLLEQPPKISEEMNKFAQEFEAAFGITRS